MEKPVMRIIRPPEGTPEELEAAGRRVIIETFGLPPDATEAEVDAAVMRGMSRHVRKTSPESR